MLHKNILEVMDTSGHTSVTWDPDNEAEVSLAKATFDQAREAGMHAFRIEKGGRQGGRITEFDPAAERMVLIPQLRGG